MTKVSKRQDLAVEERPLPQGVRTLSVADIELGAVLGSGGFSNVFSCALSQEQAQEAVPMKSRSHETCSKENTPTNVMDKNIPPALVQTWSSGSGGSSSSSHSSRRSTSPLHSTTTDPDTIQDSHSQHEKLPLHQNQSAIQQPADATNSSKKNQKNKSSKHSKGPSSTAASSGSPQLFAFKTVHSKVLENNTKGRKHAVEGLMMEVSILTSRRFAQHPHIINLHGISEDFWTAGQVLKQSKGDAAECGASVFIVLERLPRTLDQVLHAWKHSKKQQNPSPAWMFWNHHRPGGVVSSREEERIHKVLPSLCSALVCLHQNGIVHRDVKPGNIGFDHQGTLKLFDFGSARMLQTAKNKKSTTKTHLTSRAGTLRYMAPEVYQKKPSDFSADVFSVGMLLWELCSLQKPYSKAGNDATALGELVLSSQMPPISEDWPKWIAPLIVKCWAASPHKRPVMENVLAYLQKHLRHLDEEEEHKKKKLPTQRQ